IIATTTWPFTAADAASDEFRDNFIRAYGAVPGALEAASYDAVKLLEAAIGQPGELLNNLASLDNIEGVQGVLRPARLTRGETGTNVAVVQLGDFGAPQVMSRYEGGQKLTDVTQPIPTPTVAPTATPAGVVITITQARQNVRSGPSTNYAVLGQLSEGDQAQVIGATTDLAWVVIDYRGQQGWLATYLLEVFGDLNTVPIITPPPTPTPPPTSTALPVADVVIDAASVVPSPIIVNQVFTVSVSVRNAGNVPAGQFAIAATFPPNNIYSAVTIPSLGPGQSTIATLSGTFTNTGFYSVAIVADLNNQLAEGPGENNNIFNFSYGINKPVLRSGAQTLNPGETLDLEGNAVQGDVNWNVNGQQLDILGAARVGVIPNVTLENIHWDLINSSIVNQTSISRLAMNAGTIIGVITADGNRGAIRVDDIPGNQFKVTFIVYQN
ncbi:MAG: SH3 domain-containing protein, partial [Anaerolineae bacterium]|nr:SH3 domain-containing protein [Anaerolineae bacterium]